MGVVDDVMKHLERWEVWKRVSATPDRVDALEKRVIELETYSVAHTRQMSVGTAERGGCGSMA